MHWIDLDEQGEPAGWNHVACKVQWAEGTYVIDTTWQQFGNKGCDNPIFIGSADEWMKLILQNQDKVQTSKFQPLDKVPTDNAMMLEVMGYEKDYKDSQQKTSSQNTQQPLTTIKSKDNSCCIIQ